LFLVDDGVRSAAELAPADKNQRSHRGQALRALVAALAPVAP
jgi:inosine/xanthosine triphosphate pyrophosphatase family protein